MKRVVAAWVLVYATAGAASAQDRSGGEIRVTFSGAYAAVAIDGDDNFVVVWDNGYQDGDREGVFGRRFDPSGSALGPAFRVNAYTTGFQIKPAIAMRPSGEFVVVWQSFGQDGSYSGIFGRLYDAAGTPVGDEFPVNSATTNVQNLPAVAMHASGDFVVAWTGYEPATQWDVWARRFDPAANPQGPDFRVNAYVTSDQTAPSLAFDGAGNLVIVWQSQGRDIQGAPAPPSFSFGRRYDAAGSPQGPDFLVGEANAEKPRIAVSTAGNFLVVWSAPLGYPYVSKIRARAFDSSGVPASAEVQIADTLALDAAAAVDDAGEFVVAWTQGLDYDDYNYVIEGYHIRTRRFDAALNAQGPESPANTQWGIPRRRPVVATRNPGRFVVAWEAGRLPGTGDVRARAPDVIFVDAFETGDLSFWSLSEVDSGDLRAGTAARMASQSSQSVYGLEATVDDTAAVHVQDDSPAAEPRYRARFYFDPNGFDPGESSGQLRQKIFLALSDAPTKRLVLLMLRRMGGQYAIGAQIRRDDDTLAKTAFFNVTDGPHAIEFDWQKATAPGADDGRFEMWIDGTSVVTVNGLDNDDRPVDFVRMGALSVKAGASGTLFFDEFVSRRLAYIGP